jgi:hypothetical protein
VETWTLRKVGQEYLGSSEMWCWRRMENIIWIDRVTNEVLHIVKEYRNFLHEIKRREADRVGTVLPRNCLSKMRYLRKDRRKDRREGEKRKKA